MAAEIIKSNESLADVRDRIETHCIALAGNPNAGKTTLFNLLTGLRARTANYPGTTVERRVARMRLGDHAVEILDLPGMYSLEAATPDEKVAGDALLGRLPGQRRPDAVVVIADATNLERNLVLVSQLLEHDILIIMGLNMMDIAERRGIHVDAEKLSQELGIPVIPLVATSGRGLEDLRSELEKIIAPDIRKALLQSRRTPPCACCAGCAYKERFAWTESVASRVTKSPTVAKGSRTDAIDKFLTHPAIGIASFFLVMLAVFYLIFQVATVPMDLIDALFASVGSFAAHVLPEGDVQSLVVNGIIGGVGGILVFLPQICILFFFLSLLEDTGYLARAAFVMDRLMSRIGLPGTAFVPLVSAHACAIPAIMATRVIQDKRDRLLTILVVPLMTCSARIPVYAMLTALLFPHSPLLAATFFTGAYGLGVVAALGMAFVFRRTILPGKRQPLVLELPSYKLPSLRNSLLYTADRAWVFIRQAGTIILLISIGLWALSTYPKSDVPDDVIASRAWAQQLVEDGDTAKAAEIEASADRLAAQHALSRSFAGRLGHLIEPVVRPLGYDWQIGIGIVSSFAAREVIVSTLSIVYGVGEDTADNKSSTLYDTLRRATRKDGSPVFTVATSISLLVFYVLAMQCLPTQAVTKRETNSWKWPVFQLVYMTILAYGAALLVYQILRFAGVT
ncbi:MAG: ferrous iron transport protein B [Verrucomicrobia bacterium]|nr:ferrous iron transport protein B [Verrucomicrobiota bacterium]